MSADRLREAARVLRERTEAATPGPWGTHPDMWHDVPVNRIGSDGVGVDVGLTPDELIPHPRGKADATYIATMHPGVALVLVDWLDACAKYHDAYPDYTHDGEDYAVRLAEQIVEPRA